MKINGTAECFARIMYDGEAAIQKIELKDYNKILSRFPKGTRIKILCHKDDSYKWIEVVSADIDKRSLYNIYRDDLFGFEVLCDSDFRIDIPSIPKKIWDVNRCTFSSIVMGLMCLDKYADYKVKWIDENDKECGYSLKSFLANRKKLTKYNIRLYSSNDIEFDIKIFITDMAFIFNEKMFPTVPWGPELKLYLSLISDWVLTPAILNKSFNILNVRPFVYYELYPFMYLLYQDEYLHSLFQLNSYSHEHRILKFERLRFNLLPNQRICSNIKLILEDEVYRPVVVAHSFPVRWLNE